MVQKLAVGVFISISILIQGCTTMDAYTGEEKTSKATKGAAIGAVVGAVVGIASSDSSRKRKERALKLAGIGAIAGMTTGRYMDAQEAKLRQKLEASGVSVTRDGDNIILNMPGNITFETNKSDVKTSFVDVLDSVAEVLKEYKSTMIEVAGHTDSTGTDSYNLLLSKDRAQSVSNQLIGFGVEPVRIDTVGYGESNPVASNDTPQGRQQNRRVELTLLPYQG